VFSIRVWSIDHDIGLGKREFWEGEIGVFYCVSDFVSFTEVKIRGIKGGVNRQVGSDFDPSTVAFGLLSPRTLPVMEGTIESP
jgi:hypothetical protein